MLKRSAPNAEEHLKSLSSWENARNRSEVMIRPLSPSNYQLALITVILLFFFSSEEPREITASSSLHIHRAHLNVLSSNLIFVLVAVSPSRNNNYSVH